MGKDKLRKFAENLTFECFVQPAFEEMFRCDHPLKGNWRRDFFKNDNPIVLELGCGRGEYTVELAGRFPDKNFIGVDIKGARMWTGATDAIKNNLTNVGFLRTRIEIIDH
jgi:tRNA (guanine-N7-)-methyltransferase